MEISTRRAASGMTGSCALPSANSRRSQADKHGLSDHENLRPNRFIDKLAVRNHDYCRSPLAEF